MGFFSDLRNDLSQAVNELIPGENTEQQEVGNSSRELFVKEDSYRDEEEEQDGGYDADLSRMLDKMDEMEVPHKDQEISPRSSEEVSRGEEKEKVKEEVKKPETEVAILTGNTVIKGNITSKEDLEVKGNIIGDVEALGRLTISGSIQGNSQAAEISVKGAKVDGEMRSSGNVEVGPSSVITGNIYAGSAVIAGAVKGDIDVKESLTLDSSAVVLGNIKSKAVQINKGAILEGMCSQCYAEVNPSSFFEDGKEEK